MIQFFLQAKNSQTHRSKLLQAKCFIQRLSHFLQTQTLPLLSKYIFQKVQQILRRLVAYFKPQIILNLTQN
eukprot:UN06959